MMVASGTNSFAKEMAIRKRIASITFNLVEGIDVPAIEEKIAEYEKENAEQIMNAQARKAEEYAAALAASKGQPAQADSDMRMGMSQSSQVGVAAGAYAPAVAGGGIAQPRPTGVALLPIPIGSNHDTQGYDIDDEEMMKLRAERGIRAGGWSVELSRKRALEEAFSSIWI
ncbi:unnamed protein product [Camellia sinensis]